MVALGCMTLPNSQPLSRLLCRYRKNLNGFHFFARHLSGQGGDPLGHTDLLFCGELRKHRKGDDTCRDATRYGKISRTVIQPRIGHLHMERNWIVDTSADAVV